MSSSKEIAVLGPTGNIGSALCRFLLENQVPFRTGNRQDFDFTKPQTHIPFLKGATDLFLLVPLSPALVEVTEDLVKAAREARIQRIIKISALGANSNASSRIQKLHGEADRVVLESGISSIILRPNAFMQNFVQYYGMGIARSSSFSLPVGRQTISFVSTEDIAQVAYEAFQNFTNFPSALDITGPEAHSFFDAASLFSEALGRPVRFIEVTEQAYQEKMAGLRIPAWNVEALVELYATYRRGEAALVNNNVATYAKQIPITLEKFIQKNLSTWKGQS